MHLILMPPYCLGGINFCVSSLHLLKKTSGEELLSILGLIIPIRLAKNEAITVIL